MKRLIFGVGLAISLSGLADKSFTELQNQIKEQQRLLVEAEVKKRGVLGALYQINKQLATASIETEKLQGQMEHFKNSVKGQARTVVQLQSKLDNESVLLRSRLRAIYRLGTSGTAKIIFSSKTPGQLARNIKYLALVASHTKRLIGEYSKNLQNLEVAQRKLKRQVEFFARKKRAYEEKLSVLNEEKAKQKLLLLDIDRNRERHLAALTEHRNAARKMEEQMKKIAGEKSDVLPMSFLEAKGKLKRPITGSIVQKYGLVVNKRFRTKLFHKGLFFKAATGLNVSAPFWGKVAFSGWLDGFGETIIVDHGDRFYSLYSHNSRLLKKKGDSVSQGEAIAVSGDTASLRGPGLYFEIRHFSESLDPMHWLDLKEWRSL